MVAAKEKTLSFNVDPIANRMDSQPARQRAASTAPTAINRISSYDFRTRKFKKSPIGPKVKIGCIVSLEIHQRPRKYVGENVPQLRRSHWAPCMSLYRGYFVPNGMDPKGTSFAGRLFNQCFQRCKGRHSLPNGLNSSAQLAACSIACTLVSRCRINLRNCSTVLGRAFRASDRLNPSTTPEALAVLLCDIIFP